MKALALLLVIGLTVAPTMGRAAEVYLQCDFAGGVQATMTFKLKAEGEVISGISVAAPNWGTMQLDRATSGQLIAHMNRGTSAHPDAVLTFVANRITGHASVFYSPPVKDALDLFNEGTPYQKGVGSCQR